MGGRGWGGVLLSLVGQDKVEGSLLVSEDVYYLSEVQLGHRVPDVQAVIILVDYQLGSKEPHS